MVLVWVEVWRLLVKEVGQQGSVNWMGGGVVDEQHWGLTLTFLASVATSF
jgi:hypothetical protein